MKMNLLWLNFNEKYLPMKTIITSESESRIGLFSFTPIFLFYKILVIKVITKKQVL